MVVMTRNYDDFISLEDRCHIANETNSDIFVSIHCSPFISTDAEEIETYFYPDSYKRMRLATFIQGKLIERRDRMDRSVKEGNYYVLKNTGMPTALTGLMFPSNFEECKVLSNAEAKEACARAIFNGIMLYFN